VGARAKTVRGQNVIVSLFAVDMSPFDLRVVEKRDSAGALAKFQLVLANQVLCIKTSYRMREAQLSHRPVDVRGRNPIWW
jgi:hypothetical protein